MHKMKKQAITVGQAKIEDVDMKDDEAETIQINTSSKGEMDIQDDSVKDRWSRYIGVMGVDSVAK